ncbi:uncharacterized protein LOC127261974 [Andrographis paniculata]|uniref:uncharacterized protein LOC127261974 n=1 Tax=Andrographis paniculata TaxID=175694 RepID=UPI0021E8F116|nr:uncharacterized protein LOC127261974 [Andrographis paniculata]
MCMMIMKCSIPEAFRGSFAESKTAKSFLEAVEQYFAKNEKVEANFPVCVEFIKGKQTNIKKLGADSSKEVLECIRTDICVEVELQLGKTIKAIRSNRVGEYYGRFDGSGEQHPRPFGIFLKECESLWGEALKTAVHIFNRVLSKTVSKTPYECWVAKKPNLRHFQIWGCPEEVRPYRAHEARTVSYCFVGYPEHSRAYKFYNPTSRTFFEMRNAIFLEKIEFEREEVIRNIAFEEDFVVDNDLVIAYHCSGFNPSEHEDGICLTELDPTTIGQAMLSYNSQRWINAMKDEMKSMSDNDVWARLVAKGFTQMVGIDYIETFSLISSKNFFRTIMALVAHFDLELHQMDVKTAFLNGDIKKTIYMVQPENFVSGDAKSKMEAIMDAQGTVKEIWEALMTRYLEADRVQGQDYIC